MEITTIGQYGLILRDNKLLLLKRAHSGNWALPGGRIETAADPYSELAREIREELQAEVLASKPVDVAIFKDEYQVKYAVLFRVETASENIAISPEHSEYRFFSKAEVEQLDSLDGYAGLKERVVKLIN